MGFEDYIFRLSREDRIQLLREVLDTLVPDEKYGVIIMLERELNAMNYDWRVFATDDKVRR